MHKLNEEAYSNPELWQRRATAAMTTRLAEQPHPAARVTQSSSYDSADRLPGRYTTSCLPAFLTDSFNTPGFSESQVVVRRMTLNDIIPIDENQCFIILFFIDL